MEATIDTLKIYERLRAANLDERAAKEIAEVIKDTIDASLATKRDIKELEIALKRDIAELETRLTIRMGAMIVSAVAVIAAIVKLL